MMYNKEGHCKVINGPSLEIQGSGTRTVPKQGPVYEVSCELNQIKVPLIAEMLCTQTHMRRHFVTARKFVSRAWITFTYILEARREGY